MFLLEVLTTIQRIFTKKKFKQTHSNEWTGFKGREFIPMERKKVIYNAEGITNNITCFIDRNNKEINLEELRAILTRNRKQLDLEITYRSEMLEEHFHKWYKF